jgi:hypothetical protein
MPASIQGLIKKIPGADAAVSFFVFFMRFEYALKRTNYLKKGRRGRAEADWKKFALDLGKLFFDEVRSSGRAATLIDTPPKRQVVTNNELDWKEVKSIDGTIELLEAIRRTRNNLFHGGKVPIEGRDIELIFQSQYVLESALEKRPRVKAAFYEGFY